MCVCLLACVCMCLWQLQICGLLVCSNSKTEIRANGKFGIRKWNCFHTNSLLAKWKSFTQHIAQCCRVQCVLRYTCTQNGRMHILFNRCASVCSQPITFYMAKIKRINIDKSYSFSPVHSFHLFFRFRLSFSSHMAFPFVVVFVF